MRKTAAALILAGLFTAAFCTGCSSGNAPPKTEAILECKVMQVNEDSLLLAGQDAGGLYTASANTDIYSAENKPEDASALKAGQTVEIGFSGAVMESYPAQIGEPVYIRIMSQGDDLVGLYQTVFDGLWNVDSGLNSDVETLAFDLSKASNLSESEKAALIYLVSGSHGLFGISGTFDELTEQGYIEKDPLIFNRGLLLQLEVTSETQNGFVFNASKWASGDGAYFYQDCKAFQRNGKWEYSIGSEAIS